MKDSEKVEQVREWYSQAEGEHDAFCRDAERNLSYFYYEGNAADTTWTPFDLANAKRQGRPIVHIPVIKPMVKLIAGLQAQNPLEILCVPREGGDKPVADLFSELLKYTYDTNEMDSIDSQFFTMGIIARRSFCAVDYKPDFPFGKIILKYEDPRNVVIDPYGMEYNGGDHNFRMRIRWLTANEIAVHFGRDKAKKIIDERSAELFDDIHSVRYTPGKEWKTYKVIECEWKEYKDIKCLFDYQMLEQYEVNADGMIEQQSPMGMEYINAQALAELIPDRYKIKQQTVSKMHITTVCGYTMLEDGESVFSDNKYAAENFKTIMFAPMFMNGKSTSIVDDLIDLQREENLTHSQMLHMINKAANHAWAVERGALANPKVMYDFGSVPGVVIEMAEGKLYGQHLRRIDPGVVPQLDKILDTANKAKAAVGLNPDLLGMQDKTASGRAIALRVQQGTTIIAPDTVPYISSKKTVGKMCLAALQSKMSVKQAARITAQDPQFISELLRNQEAAQYDVVAQETPKSVTMREANWEKIKEAIQNQIIPVMPQTIPIILKAMDLPFTDEFIAALAQQQMQGGPPPPGGEQPEQPAPKGPGGVPQSQMGVTPADMGQGPADGAVA